MLRIEREEMKIKIEEIRREVTEVELLPCPFCGGEDLGVKTDSNMYERVGSIRAVAICNTCRAQEMRNTCRAQAMCNTCRAQGPIAEIKGFESEAKKAAIKLWNRRSEREW